MDERALADNLDRFLDELAAGPAGDRPTLDPELTEIARRYRAVGRMPAPEDVRDRVRKRLEGTSTAGEELPAISPISPNGTTSSSRWSGGEPGTSQARAERRWGFAQLAIAAVLLLVGLGIGYIVFGPGFGDENRTTIPAAVEPAATPAPAATPDPDLATIDLPAGALPEGLVGATLARWTMPPDSRINIENAQDILLRYVVSGRVSVRSADPLRVLRAAGDGRWAGVPAGVEVALGPGDALVQLRATETEFVNTDPTPVEFVAWNLAAGQSSISDPPQGWVRHDFSGTNGAALGQPDAPARVRLRRVELAPGEELVPPAGVLLHQTVSESGSVLAGLAGGGLRNVGRQPATIYELVLAPLGGSRDDPGVGSPPPVVHTEDNDQSAAPEENGGNASPVPSHRGNRIGH